MSDKLVALQMADELDSLCDPYDSAIATELRRLHALNAELMEALRHIEPILARMYGAQAADLPPMQIVRAALAKVEASNG